MVRLTLAKHPGLRILVPVSDGERIVAESGGRLTLGQPAPPRPSGSLQKSAR